MGNFRHNLPSTCVIRLTPAELMHCPWNVETERIYLDPDHLWDTLENARVFNNLNYIVRMDWWYDVNFERPRCEIVRVRQYYDGRREALDVMVTKSVREVSSSVGEGWRRSKESRRSSR